MTKREEVMQRALDMTRAHMNPENWVKPPTPLQAACWFAAYTTAQTLYDLNTRELAESVEMGIGPFKTEDDLWGHFEGYFEDPDAPTESEIVALLETIAAFFDE